jgi:hypothetical protein
VALSVSLGQDIDFVNVFGAAIRKCAVIKNYELTRDHIALNDERSETVQVLFYFFTSRTIMHGVVIKHTDSLLECN